MKISRKMIKFTGNYYFYVIIITLLIMILTITVSFKIYYIHWQLQFFILFTDNNVFTDNYCQIHFPLTTTFPRSIHCQWQKQHRLTTTLTDPWKPRNHWASLYQYWHFYLYKSRIRTTKPESEPQISYQFLNENRSLAIITHERYLLFF